MMGDGAVQPTASNPSATVHDCFHPYSVHTQVAVCFMALSIFYFRCPASLSQPGVGILLVLAGLLPLQAPPFL